ncbi:MAG: hypothetical protein JO244_04885 [Solirubrobacterales bacterium]|nr:hypothetical protein [Solirubrobacterales bacterium]
MSAPGFTAFDLDLPAGSKNKTATLITGDNEALPAGRGETLLSDLEATLDSSVVIRHVADRAAAVR